MQEGTTSVPCVARDVGEADRNRSGAVLLAALHRTTRDRFSLAPEGEAGLNTLCADYQPFFQHGDDAMHFMAHEVRFKRAPANLRAYVVQQDMVGDTG